VRAIHAQTTTRPPGRSTRRASRSAPGLSAMCSVLSIANAASKLASGRPFASQSPSA
jgi:hypothetical protein